MRLQHLTTTIQIPQIVLFLLLVISAAVVNAQRVAPGIPPQQYQHVPVQQQQHPPPPQYQQQQQPIHHAPGVAPQHYQPQQQQQQQPNVQYQQVPVQQQPQQQQQQYAPQVQQQQHQQQYQQPQQHAQHHAHGQPQQVLNAANMEHERAHIQEHMQVPIDTSKMSEAELQFHYFKMHDSDNNNKLDGCELIKSLIHWHVDDQGNAKTDAAAGEGTGQKNGTIYSDRKLEDIIDYVLQTMDLNKDGYVDYTEYRKSEEADKKTKDPTK